MTTALHLVVAGALTQRTGGYIYCAEIVAALHAQGERVVVHELPGAFPDVDRVAIAAAAALAADLRDGSGPVIDGLALPAFAPKTLDRLEAIALIHHPLALETGLMAAVAARLGRAERERLERMPRVVVTSQHTADVLAQDYKVARKRIRVVVPGVPSAVAVPWRRRRRLRLLAVGTLTPRKGHGTLVRALAGLGPAMRRRWTLTIAGAARDPDEARRLARLIVQHGLQRRVALAGELRSAALERAWRSSDLFVLASHYEGYGMAYAEALRHGLPVIGTRAGAVPGVVPSGAGTLVRPGDARTLGRALYAAVTRPERRRAQAVAARAAGARLPDWPTTASRFLAAVRR